MGMEHGKRCIRFAKALRLDFFPRLVQPATGERYASPLPSYQHFSAMGSDPIETETPLRPLRCNFGIIHGAATSLFVFTSRYSTEKRRAVAALFYPAIRAKPKNG